MSYDHSLEEKKQCELNYLQVKRHHRKLCRNLKAKASLERDVKLLSNPAATFASIRMARRSRAGTLQKLTVNDKIYYNEAVKDGFFESIKQLKTKDHDRLMRGSNYSDFLNDYTYIMKICQDSPPIQQISEEKALELLNRLKPHVPDLYSITPAHYLYAGPTGWKYFCSLLNFLIADIRNISIVEVNQAYACILFKGHSKDKTSSRSYRTISTCPVVAKALDLHIRDLHVVNWNENQPETQFQGQGSSHELAALLLTECIQYSLYASKSPLFVLYLDARSAFDLVQKELLVRNLYPMHDQDQSIMYIDQRLQNRQTVLDWEGVLMGPICDEQGLEQGGSCSSDLYKIYGREQLNLAQKSCLGTLLGKLSVSAIGLADDTALVSNDIHSLFYLLELTKFFGDKFFVEQNAEKIKLQVYTRKGIPYDHEYTSLTNPIVVNGKPIRLSSEADHVGILRSSNGNGPTLTDRFSAHKKALASVLHSGLARGHRANPTLSIRIEKLYALPVLLSGLASLVLLRSEVDLIERHFSETLRRLLRLQEKTPKCVVYFLAGCLPGSALLHLRQLSLFSMIIRLPKKNILHQHASNILECKTISPKSWFMQIRDICLLYGLPHPSSLLKNPPTKETFKVMAKKKCVDYWEKELRSQARGLKSLKYFKPEFMSLTTPHPIFYTAGRSPYSVSMATVQAVMLSGRYPCDSLLRHWSMKISGICMLSSSCSDSGISDDLQHILQDCPALQTTRVKLSDFTKCYMVDNDLPSNLKDIINYSFEPTYPQFTSFLIDCSSFPYVISAAQSLGSDVLFHLFTLSRIWNFTLHKERLKLRGEWKRKFR